MLVVVEASSVRDSEGQSAYIAVVNLITGKIIGSNGV